jgi:hypothetical protein
MIAQEGVIAESDPGFMPSWQSSPVVPYYNYKLGRSCLSLQSTVWTHCELLFTGSPIFLISSPAAVAEAAASSSWASSFIGNDEDENEPMSGNDLSIINLSMT